MTIARKYNPGFLTDDDLVASFCVRRNEFESMVEMLRDCTGSSNPHQIVIGPRGSGKTSLLLRIAAEVRREAGLSSRFFAVVFAEESYEVATAGEFWLECLSRLAAQAPRREGGPDLQRTVEDLRTIRDDQILAERCLASLLDFSDREGKRLVLMVENLNMMFQDMADADTGWRLRQTLQTEPRIVMLASATSRFDEIDNPEHALYDLFRVRTLHPLDADECAVLWEEVSGRRPAPGTVRSLEILTGGSPRLLAIVARFGADRSFRELMADLLDLVDDHTEYFKSHIESLPPQERRVYLALADLWKPATTREIADRSRLGTSSCSAHLARLIERGVVQVEGGTARRKQYYLTERLYNVYYLLRRRHGADRLVEALVHFMESYYSPLDLIDIGAGIIHDAEGFSEETRALYRIEESDSPDSFAMAERAQLQKAEMELRRQRYEAAIETVDQVLGECRTESPENRLRAHLIRAEATLATGDETGFEQDIKGILAVLPQMKHLPKAILGALITSSVELGPARMCDLIQASPSASLLLPLTTALQHELGLELRVAREVEEVARDVRQDLAKLREDRTREDGRATRLSGNASGVWSRTTGR